MDAGYTTPEGFYLSRAPLLPDARSFSDVLEYLGEWDHETMSHRGGKEPTRAVPPRTIGRNEIGPFATIDGAGSHRAIAVRATDAVINAVAGQIVTDDDHLSFTIHIHKDRNRALVTLQHGYIIGSHWLAYIDVDTLPAYPYAARDKRKADLVEAMRGNDYTPFVRNLPGGDIELSTRDNPDIKALIRADGTSELTWPDGSKSVDSLP